MNNINQTKALINKYLKDIKALNQFTFKFNPDKTLSIKLNPFIYQSLEKCSTGVYFGLVIFEKDGQYSTKSIIQCIDTLLAFKKQCLDSAYKV